MRHFATSRKGQNVMPKHGFGIADILSSGVSLNVPPFKGQRSTLQLKRVRKLKESVQIHAECAIARLKNFHLLNGVVPLSVVI